MAELHLAWLQERLPHVEKLRARYDQVRSKLEPLAADPGVTSRNADRVDRLRAQLAGGGHCLTARTRMAQL